MRIKSVTHITSPLSKRTIDVISLNKKHRVVVSTNYLHNKPTDRFIKLFNQLGELIKAKLKHYNKDGKCIQNHKA